MTASLRLKITSAGFGVPTGLGLAVLGMGLGEAALGLPAVVDEPPQAEAASNSRKTTEVARCTVAGGLPRGRAASRPFLGSGRTRFISKASLD